MLVFEERGNPENPEENLSEQGMETKKHLNPHMTPGSGIKPGTPPQHHLCSLRLYFQLNHTLLKVVLHFLMEEERTFPFTIAKENGNYNSKLFIIFLGTWKIIKLNRCQVTTKATFHQN